MISLLTPAQQDLHTVMDGLAEPMALCDSSGRLVSANALAWSALHESFELEVGTFVGFNLSVRTTASHIIPTARVAQPDESEFFLAGVQVLTLADPSLVPSPSDQGRDSWTGWTVVGTLDVVLMPLPSGNFWIRIGESTGAVGVIERPGGRPRQILRQLAALHQSVAVLETAEEIVDLFATTLRALLDDFALVIYVAGRSTPGRNEPGLTTRLTLDGQLSHVRSSASNLGNDENLNLSSSELQLPETVRGCRYPLDATGPTVGVLQAETARAEHFSPEEKEVLLLASQHLAMALARGGSRDGERIQVADRSLDEIEILVAVCDSRRRVRSANSFLNARCDTPSVVGLDLLDLLDARDREQVRRLASLAMGSGESRTVDCRLESSARRYVLHLAPLGTPGGITGVSAVFHAGTDGSSVSVEEVRMRRELETKLVEAERFISFGKLAAGIAHELKNPLTSISAYSEYLLSKYQDRLLDPRDIARFQQIITSVERIDHFVSDLLDYARPHDEAPEMMSLHARCREALLLSEVSLRGVDVSLELGAVDDHVYAVGTHIHQILINLLSNAAASMTGSERAVSVATHNLNGSVVLTVSDRGHGIAEDEIDRIFEPFWTTRADSGGTGLGLAIVQGLVQRASGSVSVESQVDVGTRFTVTFPSAQSSGRSA